MVENPYESPREAGYRAPQQPRFDANTKDRMLLIVTGVVSFAALMGLFGVSILVKSYFPGIRDSAVKAAILASVTCIVLLTFAVFKWGIRRG